MKIVRVINNLLHLRGFVEAVAFFDCLRRQTCTYRHCTDILDVLLLSLLLFFKAPISRVCLSKVYLGGGSNTYFASYNTKTVLDILRLKMLLFTVLYLLVNTFLVVHYSLTCIVFSHSYYFIGILFKHFEHIKTIFYPKSSMVYFEYF